VKVKFRSPLCSLKRRPEKGNFSESAKSSKAEQKGAKKGKCKFTGFVDKRTLGLQPSESARAR
jgi:hypothetical protein